MSGALAGVPVPRATAPIDEIRGRLGVHPLPPYVAVGCGRDVGEDGAALLEHPNRVPIGAGARSRSNAEVAGFGINRPETAVGADAEPCDILADGEDAPSFERSRRVEHREIGFAARAGKRAENVARLALGILDADDEHVL